MSCDFGKVRRLDIRIVAFLARDLLCRNRERRRGRFRHRIGHRSHVDVNRRSRSDCGCQSDRICRVPLWSRICARDVGFDDEIRIAADEDKMFDIIASYNHELTLPVDTECIDNAEAGQASAAAPVISSARSHDLAKHISKHGQQDEDPGQSQNINIGLRDSHPEKRIHPPDLLVDCLDPSATGSVQFGGEKRAGSGQTRFLVKILFTTINEASEMKTRNVVPKPRSEWPMSSNSVNHIPLDLYKPVAEIIGYVMRLKRGQRVRYSSMRGRE